MTPHPQRAFTFKDLLKLPLHLNRLAFLFCLRVILNVFFNIRAEGVERVTRSGGSIVTYRHTALYDLFLVLASLPLREAMHCIVPFVRAKGTLGRLQTAVLPLFLRSLPVTGIRTPDTLEECVLHIRSGASLILPSIVHTGQGRLKKKHEYFKEIGFLACKAHASIFPLSLQWDLVRRRGRGPAILRSFKQKVRIRLGNSIHPSEFQTVQKGVAKMGTYRKVGVRIQESMN